jgi:hypothetical protein
MKPRKRIVRQALMPLMAILILALGLTGAAQAADAPASTDEATGGEATIRPGTASDGVTRGTTIRHKDGSVEWFIDPEVVEKARMQVQGDGYPKCGSACDGKDPNSYWASGYVPGIGVTQWKCEPLPEPIYTYRPSPYPNDAYVELRWSPRCETSWARGCCYTNFRIRGYYSSSGGLRTYATAYGRGSGSRIWTAMLDNSSPLVAEACYDNHLGTGTPDWRCGPKW